MTGVSSAQFEVFQQQSRTATVAGLTVMTLTVIESFNFTLNYIIIIPNIKWDWWGCICARVGGDVGWG